MIQWRACTKWLSSGQTSKHNGTAKVTNRDRSAWLSDIPNNVWMCELAFRSKQSKQGLISGMRSHWDRSWFLHFVQQDLSTREGRRSCKSRYARSWVSMIGCPSLGVWVAGLITSTQRLERWVLSTSCTGGMNNEHVMQQCHAAWFLVLLFLWVLICCAVTWWFCTLLPFRERQPHHVTVRRIKSIGSGPIMMRFLYI